MKFYLEKDFTILNSIKLKFIELDLYFPIYVH